MWSTQRHRNAMEGAKNTQDTLAENIPVAGQAYSGIKAITAYNPIKNEKLSTTEVIVAGLGAIPAFGLGDDAADAGRLAAKNSVAPRSLVRSALPDLPKTFAKEFDGPVRARTFKAGEKVYRSPWVPDEGTENPGQWFGTRSTVTQHGTNSMYQINKWNNPNKVLRSYEFTEDVTVYYGKVKGGTGYQVLFPKDVTPGSVLQFIGEAPLR
jgi:hypothetical protein